MVAATWTLATAVLLSGSESGLDDGDSDIGNSIATVSGVYREDRGHTLVMTPLFLKDYPCYFLSTAMPSLCKINKHNMKFWKEVNAVISSENSLLANLFYLQCKCK